MDKSKLVSRASHAIGTIVLLSVLGATSVRGAEKFTIGPDSATQKVARAKSRMRAYTTDLIGIGSFVSIGTGAGLDQLSNSPSEWGKTSSGFEKRLASNAGSRFAFVTTRHGLAAILGRSTDYVRCTCTSFGGRVGHGFVDAFTDLDRNNKRVFSEPIILGTAAGAFAPEIWRPNYGPGNALASVALTLGLSVGGNIMREFISWWP